MRIPVSLLGLLLLSCWPGFASADVTAPAAAAAAELGEPGTVLLLRHALAPGIGDPAGFDLADCSTQRNLNDTGRAQARDLGDSLRARGIDRAAARVYTSAWCRCRETAELLDLGPVTVLPALNSFFQRPRERETAMTALRDFLAAQPPAGPPLILVTHQVNITALTGHVPPSGAGIVLRLNGTREPTLVGPIAF